MMKKAIFYSLFLFTLAASCNKNACIPTVYEEKQNIKDITQETGEEVKNQKEYTSTLVPIPDAAVDPIIDRYIHFTFDRDVNQTNENRYTPLIEAVKNRDEQSMIVVLEHPKINLNETDQDGYTALHLLLILEKEEIIKSILEKGASVIPTTKYGNTALHLAAMRKNTRVFDMLLNYGADTNSVNNKGWNTLHEAVSHGREKNVRIILEKGSYINEKDIYGKKPIDIARERGNTDIVALLTRAGAR